MLTPMIDLSITEDSNELTLLIHCRYFFKIFDFQSTGTSGESWAFLPLLLNFCLPQALWLWSWGVWGPWDFGSDGRDHSPAEPLSGGGTCSVPAGLRPEPSLCSSLPHFRGNIPSAALREQSQIWKEQSAQQEAGWKLERCQVLPKHQPLMAQEEQLSSRTPSVHGFTHI